MRNSGLSIIGICVLSGLLIASAGLPAVYPTPDTMPQVPSNFANLMELESISNAQLVLANNAPMKLAVDRYMAMKAEEKRVEQARQEAAAVEAARKSTAEAAQNETGTAEGVSISTTAVVVATPTGDAQAAPSSASGTELSRAQRILASHIAKNPILQGATVEITDCPNNWQGCTYYREARILIDPDHRASLERIIAHECNHIIDWRSDGDIDYNDYHD